MGNLTVYPEALIGDIADVGGIVYQDFRSAAGIQSNLKVQFIEALNKLPSVRQRVVSTMAEMLVDTDVISGVASGGLELAGDIAFETGKPLVEVQKYENGGQKTFRLTGDISALKGRPKVGLAEDVTSTAYSLLLASRCFGNLVIKAAVGVRRGIPAPVSMSNRDIGRYNKDYPYRVPLEYHTQFPIEAVVTRGIPLLLQKAEEVEKWLPELEGINWQK